MISLPRLDSTDCHFPDPATALTEPNGLLATGGSLSTTTLLEAYHQGIFPWFDENQPILWWTPDPRMVLFPDELHVSRSLAKAIRKSSLTLTTDKAFSEVIKACSGTRHYAEGTWITNDMIDAYISLHIMGAAHSVEAWQEDTLVGGLYGLAIGNVFFGESMFSLQDYASKIAFVYLVNKLAELDYQLIDCQVKSPYLASFGAREIQRSEFMTYLPGKPDFSRNRAHWPLQ